MKTKPEIQRTELIADTGIFRIEAVDLAFANGQQRRYQRLLGGKRGAVMIVAMPSDDELLLIREYATGMDRYELAFPKGAIDPGEDALAAAGRELREETGFGARRLRLLRSMTLAPGYLQHETHVVLAEDLYPAPLPGDEPEPLEVVRWSLNDVDALLARDDFTEARSIAALLLLKTAGNPE